MTEAVKKVLDILFNTMGAHRVMSDCDERNIRGWRLAARAGFRREGHLCENKRDTVGQINGDYLYGLLRPEVVG